MEVNGDDVSNTIRILIYDRQVLFSYIPKNTCKLSFHSSSFKI